MSNPLGNAAVGAGRGATIIGSRRVVKVEIHLLYGADPSVQSALIENDALTHIGPASFQSVGRIRRVRAEEVSYTEFEELLKKDDEQPGSQG